MIEIKNKTKLFVFLIIVICFLGNGVYLIFKLINFKKETKEVSQTDKSYQEGIEKLSSGDFDSASNFLEKAVKNDDDNPEKLKMLAISQYNQKKYDEAEDKFKKLLEKDQENTFVYYNSLANIYRDQEKFNEAIEYYKKSIETNPKYETAYQNLAILYLYEIDPRDPEESKKIINQGLENIPDSDVLKKMQQ